MKTLAYYAVAKTPGGNLGQLLCKRTIGADGRLVSKSQEWTGVIYKTQRAAVEDVTRLNCPEVSR